MTDPAASHATRPGPVTTNGVTRQEVARSAMWSLVENGGLALMSFVMLVVFSRLLSPADFGVFSVVLAIVEVLAVMSGMLFHDALVQREDADAECFDSAYTISLALGVVLMAACWLAAPWLSALVAAADAGWLLAVTAVSLPVSAAATVLVAQQRRSLAFRSLALRSTLSRVAGALLGLLVVVLGHGVWGLAAQYIAMAVVGWMAAVWVVSYRPRLRVVRSKTKSLLAYGLPSLGALLLAFASMRLFVVWSAVLLGPEQAGYLNLAFRLVHVLWTISSAAIGQVGLPVMSRMAARGVTVGRSLGEAAELCALLLFSAFTALAACAPDLVEVLFGAGWTPTVPAVIGLSMLIALQLPNLLAQTLLKARGHVRATLRGCAFDLVVLIALCAAVQGFGMGRERGLAMVLAAWCLREAALYVYWAAQLRRTLQIPWAAQLQPYLWPLVLSASSFAAATMFAEYLALRGDVRLRLVLVGGVALAAFWAAAAVLRGPSVRAVFALAGSALRMRSRSLAKVSV